MNQVLFCDWPYKLCLIFLLFLFFSEFLEDMYPEKAQLSPKDPFEKHKQRILVEVLGNKVSAWYKTDFGFSVAFQFEYLCPEIIGTLYACMLDINYTLLFLLFIRNSSHRPFLQISVFEEGAQVHFPKQCLVVKPNATKSP